MLFYSEIPIISLFYFAFCSKYIIFASAKCTKALQRYEK